MAEVRLNRGALEALMRSPAGPVGKDLARRCVRVQTRARQLLSGPYAKVQTGRLRSSITWEVRVDAKGLVGVVGTNVFYAPYLHEGTGIYGPRGVPIRPVRAKVLVFEVGGQLVFARQVRGVRPRPFLRDALPAAAG